MKIECYEGSSGLWSWLLKSGNNQVVCRSDDSYTSRESCGRAVKNFAEKFKTEPEIVYLPINSTGTAPEGGEGTPAA